MNYGTRSGFDLLRRVPNVSRGDGIVAREHRVSLAAKKIYRVQQVHLLAASGFVSTPASEPYQSSGTSRTSGVVSRDFWSEALCQEPVYLVRILEEKGTQDNWGRY
jgi:hypothetical protein